MQVISSRSCRPSQSNSFTSAGAVIQIPGGTSSASGSFSERGTPQVFRLLFELIPIPSIWLRSANEMVSNSYSFAKNVLQPFGKGLDGRVVQEVGPQKLNDDQPDTIHALGNFLGGSENTIPLVNRPNVISIHRLNNIRCVSSPARPFIS